MTKAAAYGTRLVFGDVNKAATFTAATNLVGVSAHGYTNGQPVLFKSAGLTGGVPLTAKRVYYAKTILTNTFEVALTAGGATVDITSDGTGTVTGMSDVAQIASLSGPNLQAGTIDVTTHDSPSAIREFVSGLIDPGEFTIGLVFDPFITTHMALWNDLVARTSAMGFGLIFPTGLSTAVPWGFEGQVTGYGPVEAQPDGAVTATVTIKLSGAPTVA